MNDNLLKLIGIGATGYVAKLFLGGPIGVLLNICLLYLMVAIPIECIYSLATGGGRLLRAEETTIEIEARLSEEHDRDMWGYTSAHNGAFTRNFDELAAKYASSWNRMGDIDRCKNGDKQTCKDLYHEWRTIRDWCRDMNLDPCSRDIWESHSNNP